MLRRLLGHLLGRLHGTSQRTGSFAAEVPASRSDGHIAVAAQAPPPPARISTPPPPPPTTPVRLLLEDGTQVLVRADPLLERRVAGVLEAIGQPPRRGASL